MFTTYFKTKKVDETATIRNARLVLNSVRDIMRDESYRLEHNISSFSTSIIQMPEGSFKRGDYKFIAGMQRANDNEETVKKVVNIINEIKEPILKDFLIGYYFYGQSTTSLKNGFYDVDDVYHTPISHISEIRRKAELSFANKVEGMVVYEE